MRVMYLLTSGQMGGAETSLLAVLASVRKAEPSWPLHVVAVANGPVVEAARTLGVEVTVLPFPAPLARLGEHGAGQRHGYIRLAAQLGLATPAAAAYVIELRRAIRAFRPDVIHTNGLKMHLLASWATDIVPLVWHLHDYLGPRPLTASLLRWNKSRCATVVANSRSVAEDARQSIGSGVKVVPVHNAVDLHRFAPDGNRVDLDRLCGMDAAPPGIVRVGIVGTFARWKGHECFLRAIARLARDVPDVSLRGYVIGDAVYQTDGSQYSAGELRNLAASLGIAERVGFAGFVLRPETALRALDIVVHASTAKEPFGLVIAEAMACGRALVVSAAGGAAELVTPGVDALAHRPGDVSELAARITELAVDRDLRARIASAARATAERAFDQDRLARELVPVYQSVTAA